MRITAILLDVEGTTTPINFVYKVLFPYARARMRDFLLRSLSDEEVRAAVEELAEQSAGETSAALPPLRLPENTQETADAVAAHVRRLMEGDRKLTPLKVLQGKVWEEGYHSGELKGEVFPDVPPSLRLWRARGATTCIYSSGSVLAQRLLFANTEHGDLSEFISDYFDTRVGAKTDPPSYSTIANKMRLPPAGIVFISDVPAELDAARAAGLQTLLCVRPGNAPTQGHTTHARIRTFDEVRFPEP